MTAWQDKIKQAIANQQIVVAAGRRVRHHADRLLFWSHSARIHRAYK